MATKDLAGGNTARETKNKPISGKGSGLLQARLQLCPERSPNYAEILRHSQERPNPENSHGFRRRNRKTRLTVRGINRRHNGHRAETRNRQDGVDRERKSV